MNKQFLLFALFVITAGSEAVGQRLFERKRPDLIPLEGQAKRIGWFVEPGITYTLPRFKDEEEEVLRSADTIYTATYDPDGKLGFYIGAGLTWFTRDPVILDYFDLGVAYKNLRGAESFESTLQRGDSIAALTGEGSFAERFVTVNANANKFIQTGDYQFVQLSLGANADFRIGSSYDHTGDPSLNQHEFPPDLITQLHFKVGYGFKLRSKLLMIPTLETPVFSFVPEDQGFGQLQWFSNKYRPLILTVRFLFLRARDGFDCPPPIKHAPGIKVYKQDGYHP